jgi:uncharacterized protein (TIGR02466 family)
MIVSHASERFQQAEILRMFPTFLWKAEVARAVAAPMNVALLDALSAAGAPLHDLEHGQSWQSPHDLHQHAPFRDLVACIHAAAMAALDHLKVEHRGLAITGCWANVNAPGAAHPEHSHPNNYLSGVYYLKVPPGADTIAFHDPRPQVGIIRPPVTALTADNTDEVVITVTEGTLLIFPAFLPHSVDAHEGAELRISLSFNLMFEAYAETMGKPSWEPGLRARNY